MFQAELIESSSEEDESGLLDEKTSRSLVDMEDLGNIMKNVKKAKVRFHPPLLGLEPLMPASINHSDRLMTSCTQQK